MARKTTGAQRRKTATKRVAALAARRGGSRVQGGATAMQQRPPEGVAFYHNRIAFDYAASPDGKP